MHPLFLAIDGGGTKTDYLLGDRDGLVINRYTGPGILHTRIGFELARKRIYEGITNVCKPANVFVKDITKTVFALSGIDFPEDTHEWMKIIESVVPPEKSIVINDSIAALFAGTNNKYGAVAICGTGFNTLAISRDGQSYGIRSQDYSLGNFGGGMHLAAMAFHSAFRADEKTGPQTDLTKSIPEVLGENSMEDVFFSFYRKGMQDEQRILIPPLVFKHALEGDEVCQDLLITMGSEMGKILSSVLVRAKLNNENMSVILGGALFQKGEGPYFIDSLVSEVHKKAPYVGYKILRDAPVFGALKVAISQEI